MRRKWKKEAFCLLISWLYSLSFQNPQQLTAHTTSNTSTSLEAWESAKKDPFPTAIISSHSNPDSARHLILKVKFQFKH